MTLKLLSICLLTLVSLLPVVTLAAPPQPTKVINVRSNAGQVQTDGTFVVWTEPEASTGEATRALYAAAIADGQRLTVATGLPTWEYGAGDIGDFAVDDGVVVWIDGAPTERAIRARNLVSGQVLTVATGAAGFPAISGNTVTWWEDVDRTQAQRPQAGLATLKARNISTMDTPVMLTQTPNTIYVDSFGPSRMTDDWVVWKKPTAAGAGLYWELRAVPLRGGDQRLLAEGWGLSFDLSGDRVAYRKFKGDGRTNVEEPLVLIDLRTGQRTESGPHGISSLTMDGHHLFWSKQNSGLWGFDARTESAFLVAEISQSGAPHARNGMVVWLRSDASGMAILISRVTDALPAARRPAPATSGADQAYFAETGHTLAGGFKVYWTRSGGLPVFGYPLTEELIEKNADSQQGHTTQYFERQRFELHPEHAGTPYDVLLGRLGVDILRAQGRDWQSFPRAAPNLPHYFPQTGHAIAPQFWDYWRSHGLEFGDAGVTEREALALFGYPISEPQLEKNSSGDQVLTQWFERARFEFHPSNPEPYKVLLGRLAYELLQQRGW